MWHNANNCNGLKWRKVYVFEKVETKDVNSKIRGISSGCRKMKDAICCEIDIKP